MFEPYFSRFADLIRRACPLVDQQEFIRKTELFFLKHAELNAIHNLTRICTPAEFFEKHIVDSLMIGLVEPQLFTTELRLADVGCGGGFPCLPLAMQNGQLLISGIESLGKKVDAVNEMAQYCGLNNVCIYKYRAREAARLTEFNQRFDIVTARAVATVDVLLKECRQLMKPNGKMIFYKTPESIDKEISLAERDAPKFGLVLKVSPVYHLSEESGDRQFFIFSKGE